MNKPILSICIPTYNRAEILRQSLESLVTQEGFSEIEVVISDNCSTDNTEKISMNFCSKYHNIHYFRNEENIRDQNFPTAIMRATGTFRKLCNDTILYNEGSVKYFLEIIKANSVNRPQIFITNGNAASDNEIIFCSSFDELLYTISFYITWIGGFGLWEEDCTNLEEEFQFCQTQLWQTIKFLDSFKKKRMALIVNRVIFDTLIVTKKNMTYNFVKVFYNNFIGVLTYYMKDKLMSESCLAYIKKDLLFNHFTQFLISMDLKTDSYEFSNEKLKDLLLTEYTNEPYFSEYKKYYSLQRKKKTREIKIIKLKELLSKSIFGRILLFSKRKLHIKLY